MTDGILENREKARMGTKLVSFRLPEERVSQLEAFAKEKRTEYASKTEIVDKAVLNFITSSPSFRFSEETLKQIDEIVEMGEYASRTQAVEEAIAYFCYGVRIGEIPIVKREENKIILRGELLEKVEAYKKRKGIEDDNEALMAMMKEAYQRILSEKL